MKALVVGVIYNLFSSMFYYLLQNLRPNSICTN